MAPYLTPLGGATPTFNTGTRMASYIFNIALKEMLDGTMDWGGANTFKLIPVMTNHSSNIDDDTVGGFSTLDEFDGSGYSAGGETITEIAPVADDSNDRAEADGNDVTFSSISAGTRQITGFILLRFVTSTSLSIPYAFIDVADFNPNGGDVTVVWNSEGIFQASDGTT